MFNYDNNIDSLSNKQPVIIIDVCNPIGTMNYERVVSKELVLPKCVLWDNRL